jgi:hypothetical protein
MFSPKKIIQTWRVSACLLLLLVLSAAFASANPGGEVQYVAVSNTEGTSTSLYLIRHAPLEATLLATQTGRTAQLVVCQGLAYWTVDSTNQTRLFRSRWGSAGTDLIANYATTGAASVALETDGHCVYWARKSAQSGTLYYWSNRTNTLAYVFGSTLFPKQLIVANHEAFLALESEATPPVLPQTQVLRFAPGASPSTVLVNSKSSLAGMALDEGNLWILQTNLGFDGDIARLTHYGLGLRDATSVHQTSGTAGQLAASAGQVVWSVQPPSASGSTTLLFRKSLDGPTQPFAATGIQQSKGLILNAHWGLWYGQGSSGVARAYPFDLFSGEIFSNSPFGNLVADTAVRVGEDVVLALKSTSGGSDRLVVFRPLDGTLKAGRDEQSGGTLGGLHGGRWHRLSYLGGALRSSDQQNFQESVYLTGSGTAVFASGEASSPYFYFAANYAPAQRQLFRLYGETVQDLGSPSASYDPRELFYWRDHIWLSFREGSRRVLGLAQYGIIQADPLAIDPTGLREFKGRLLYQQSSEVGGNRQNVMHQWGGSSEFVGDPEIPAESPCLLDYQGWAVYRSQISEKVLHAVSRPSFTTTWSYPDIPAQDPVIKGLQGWKGALVYTYQKGDGKVQLVSHEADDGSPPPSVHATADAIGLTFAHRGSLYFTRRDGTAEVLMRLPSGYEPSVQVGDLAPLGVTNLRNPLSFESTLYAVADASSGPVALAITPDSVSILPESQVGVLQNIREFHTFEGRLYAVTNSGSNTLFRKDAENWTSLYASPLSDVADFTEHGGALFFGAREGNQRYLYRLRGSTFSRVNSPNIDGSGFNPRTFARYQDLLIFSANQALEKREMWAINPFNTFLSPYQLSYLSSAGYPGHPANPIQDGPGQATLSRTRIPFNLPAGVTVGTLSAENLENAPIEWSLASLDGLFTLDGATLKLAQPSSYMYGPFIGLYIWATNSWGIRNLTEIQLEQIDPRQAWLEEYFPGQELDPDLTDDKRDPDGDGFTNIKERFWGTHPLEPSSKPKLNLSFALDGDQPQFFQMEFQTALAFPDEGRLVVSSSEDLLEWQEEGFLAPTSFGVEWFGNTSQIEATLDEANGRILYQFRDSVDMRDAPKRFFRLEINPW